MEHKLNGATIATCLSSLHSAGVRLKYVRYFCRTQNIYIYIYIYIYICVCVCGCVRVCERERERERERESACVRACVRVCVFLWFYHLSFEHLPEPYFSFLWWLFDIRIYNTASKEIWLTLYCLSLYNVDMALLSSEAAMKGLISS